MSYLDDIRKVYSYPLPTGTPQPTTAGTSPNTNTPTGSGVILDGTTYFQVADGNYANPLSLGPVTALSKPVTIYRISAFPVVMAAGNTDMPADQAIERGEALRFYPTATGWKWIDPEINSATAIVPPIAIQSHFRSANGTLLPDGTTDYTEPVSHNGFLALGQTADPVSPLTFGDPIRNDVIRMFGGTGTEQFFGFGINANTLRYQVSGASQNHRFMGAVSASASKQMMNLTDREMTIGDPLTAVGEGHWTIGTLGAGDNGYIRFKAPDASTGANKLSAEIFCDGFGGGGGGINGTLFDIRTAATALGSPTVSRIMVNGSGDILISEPSKPSFTASSGSAATVTINGSMRLAGGPMVATGGRQSGGLTFGASSTAAGTLDFAFDTDGGITSLADGDVSIFCNGARAASFSTANAFKPGGGVWGALSDIRTKRNVTAHTSNPVGVLSLPVIEFYYNGLGGTQDNNQRFVGFSAQDLLSTDFAHWVTPSRMAIDGEIWREETHQPEDQLYQVDSSNLVYELLGVVKSQAAAIAELTARLDALDSRAATVAKKK